MRYLGNKTKLLGFIESVIEKYGIEGEVFADLFSGTSSVGDYFKDRYTILANDYMGFASVIAKAKLMNAGEPAFEGFCKKYGMSPFLWLNKKEYEAFWSKSKNRPQDQKKNRKQKWPWFLLLVLLCVVAVGYVWVLHQKKGTPQLPVYTDSELSASIVDSAPDSVLTSGISDWEAMAAIGVLKDMIRTTTAVRIDMCCRFIKLLMYIE